MRAKTTSIMCCILGTPVTGHALTFDVRGGYRVGSHSYESCYRVNQGWETGWWASTEMDNRNNENNHQDNQGTDRAGGSRPSGDNTVDYNEIEANYSWPFAGKRALQPGGTYHWSNKGTQLRPYLRVSYKATPDLIFGLRYRYDYDTYKMINSTGGSYRDSANRLDLYTAYEFNAQQSVLYQGTIYCHVNDDCRYKNDKSSATENASTPRYKWNG